MLETNNSVHVMFNDDGGISISISMKREKYIEIMKTKRDLFLELIGALSEVESEDTQELSS